MVISGDIDMSPGMLAAKDYGTRVYLSSFRSATSHDLIGMSDFFFDMDLDFLSKIELKNGTES